MAVFCTVILYYSIFLLMFCYRNCKKFGQQAWLILAIIITEVLVVVKFGWETITIPIPAHIAYFWITGFLGLVGYTVWKFWIKRDVKNDVAMESREKKSEDISEVADKESVTKLRANNNNNMKGDGMQHRTRAKNGPSGL